MRTIAIIGFAGSSRDLMNKEPEDTEIWGLNNAYTQGFMKRPATRWFDVHGYDGRDEFRGEHWGKMLEMGIPIYALHPPVPIPENVNWIDYPRICSDLAIPSEYWPEQEEAPYLDSGVVPYFTNSIVYMLGQAIWELCNDKEPGHIKLFGVDMATGGEFEKQRFCCEYWVGFARGRGIKVTLPDVSPICKGLLYGIDKDDGFARRMMMDQLADLRKQLDGDLSKYWQAKGASEQVRGIAQAVKDWEEEHDENITPEAIQEIMLGISGALRTHEQECAFQYHSVDGAMQATRNLMTKLFLPQESISELLLPMMDSPGDLPPNGHEQEVNQNA